MAENPSCAGSEDCYSHSRLEMSLGSLRGVAASAVVVSARK